MRLVFDADEWLKAGGDIGDNSQFWKTAKILKVKSSDGTCLVQFADGRLSEGHFYNATMPLPQDRQMHPMCVIEVGYEPNTPAVWVDAHQPKLTVCDRHKLQFDERDDLGPFAWCEI